MFFRQCKFPSKIWFDTVTILYETSSVNCYITEMTNNVFIISEMRPFIYVDGPRISKRVGWEAPKGVGGGHDSQNPPTSASVIKVCV